MSLFAHGGDVVKNIHIHLIIIFHRREWICHLDGVKGHVHVDQSHEVLHYDLLRPDRHQFDQTLHCHCGVVFHQSGNLSTSYHAINSLNQKVSSIAMKISIFKGKTYIFWFNIEFEQEVPIISDIYCKLLLLFRIQRCGKR